MSWFSNIQPALLGNNTTFRSIFLSEAKLISGVEWILPLNLTNRPWSAPIQHSSFQVLSLLEYDQFGVFGSVIPHNSCKETAQIAQQKPLGIKFKLAWQHMKSPSCLWKSQRAENCSTHFNSYAKPYFRSSEAMTCSVPVSWTLPFEERQLQTSSPSSFISPSPFYRIHLKGFSGTAGKISSIGQPGSDFSTKDADNDKCVCKCSQLTTGGKKLIYANCFWIMSSSGKHNNHVNLW